MGGNARLNVSSNEIDIPYEYIDYAIYNYNHNAIPNLNWSFKSQVSKFVKRFFKDPYRNKDMIWIKKFTSDNDINIKLKLAILSNCYDESRIV